MWRGGVGLLISEILKEIGVLDCRIIQEQPFDTLALCDASISWKFCTFSDSKKYLNSLSEQVAMLITTEEAAEKCDTEKMGLVIAENPRVLFFRLHNYLVTCDEYARAQVANCISPTAKISGQACVADHNVMIGDNVIIEPYVIIYPNVEIGANTIIRSGARIGGEGFEFKRVDDAVMAVTHAGGVKIGENVEIQNNTCVDKAIYPWDDTVIEDYVKIDNMVQIGHAVKIGKNTMVAANATFGGRTEIARDVWVGMGTTVRNGITIGEKARINMGAVVTQDIGKGEAVSGNFAMEHSNFLRLRLEAYRILRGGGV